MKSYQECFEFFNVASQWLAKNPEDSKMKYALTKMNRKIGKINEKYKDKVEEINIECCAVDDKGIILRGDNNSYQYNKEGLLERNKKVNELFRSEVEVEPYFATEPATNLTETEKEVFTGFVIKEEE